MARPVGGTDSARGIGLFTAQSYPCRVSLVVPVRAEPRAIESQLAFERADALTGTVAMAGAVFVIVGVYPLGWSLVGLCVVSLGLDAAFDMGPLRFLADWVAQRIRE